AWGVGRCPRSRERPADGRSWEMGGARGHPRAPPAIFRAIRTALGTVQRPQTRGIVHYLLPARRCRMEPLPKGANFVRSKILWEIGLHLAGNPATPYGGNRDMVIAVGSGSSAAFR